MKSYRPTQAIGSHQRGGWRAALAWAVMLIAAALPAAAKAAATPTPTPHPTPAVHATPTAHATPTLHATPTRTPTASPAPVATPGAASCGPFGNPPARVFANVIPKCKGGVLLGPSNDSAGTPRYACLYESKLASGANPLPLVVFLHASGVTADSIQSTNLLSVLNSAVLSDQPSNGTLDANPGFILLAPEGRDIAQFYPVTNGHGAGFDYWDRQLAPGGDQTVGGTLYPENVDAATIDHFVAQEVATGKVDTSRILITGWSTGAAMAYLYGLNRPGVAAVAPYSAPNAFGALNDPCPQTPVTSAPADAAHLQIYNPALPSDHVHSNCDFAGLCPNTEAMETGLLTLGVQIQDTIIDSNQNTANGCVDACGTNPDGDASNKTAASTGLKNNQRWPTSWTPAMLDFLRAHPLTQSQN